ncbi:hypothetical protein [Aquabacterium sp.]|uniref:hypothetical protein n=1 Tax=Aquabacterium sp. TaxID=1872578 RepID=UPI003782FDD9
MAALFVTAGAARAQPAAALREPMLDQAAQLEQLDAAELPIWEALVSALPATLLPPAARQQEAALRLGALPLLAAKQQDYRVLERTPPPAGDDGGHFQARLAALRDVSDLAERAQREIRLALDRQHALMLARASRARLQLDPAALAALAPLRERRRQVAAAYETAASAWAASRAQAQAERQLQDLALADRLLAAAAGQRQAEQALQAGAAADGTPAGRLRRAAAAALATSAETQLRAAAHLAGSIDGDGLLALPAPGSSADAARSTLLARLPAAVGALRRGLAARAATLPALRALAAERDRLWDEAGYLAASAAQRQLRATWHDEARAAWQQVATLTTAAGDIASARADSGALATEQFAVAIEVLVELEDRLRQLTLALLLDPAPHGTPEPRLGDAASRWHRDLETLQAIDERWARWHAEWDRLGQAEAAAFGTLREIAAQAGQGRAAALEALAATRPAAAPQDDIGRLALGLVDAAQAQAREDAAAERQLRALHEEARTDLVVGAAMAAAAGARWREAATGLQGWTRLFDQAAALRAAAPALARAADAALPTADRLAALLQLGQALELSWLARGGGAELQLATEFDGQTYWLTGLAGAEPRLQRQREYIVQAPAAMLRPVALYEPSPSSPATRSLNVIERGMLRVGYHTLRDVYQNRYIYLSMPVISTLGGTALGSPGGLIGMGSGAVMGGAAGVMAVPVAIAQDAIGGGIKGTVKAAVAELRRVFPREQFQGPWGLKAYDIVDRFEANTDLGVDTAQSLMGLTAIIKRARHTVGYAFEDPQRLREAAVAMDRRIVRLQAFVDNQGALVKESMRQGLPLVLDEALALKNLAQVELRQMQALRASQPGIVLAAGLRSLSREAADQLADMNDLLGPLWAAEDRDRLGLLLGAIAGLFSSGTPAAATTAPARAAADPGRDAAAEQALALNRAEAQRRSTEAAQRAARAAQDPRENEQIIPREWELKAELDALRRLREQGQQTRTDPDKDKDKGPVTDGGVPPVVPVTPVKPGVPEPAETRAWWGYEAVISYQYRGAACTQTISGEFFGLRAEATEAMIDASTKALGAQSAGRSAVALVRRGFYAGPLPTRPTYTGPSGAKAVVCSAPPTPTTPTAPTPPTTPTVPAGIYEPKGSGQPCLPVGQRTQAQCKQTTDACLQKNCSGGGYSGCALDCPGCGGSFGDYTAWCPLHPSYEPKVSAGLAAFAAAIAKCQSQFLADGKPGRAQRGTDCQREAQRQLDTQKDLWVQQACEARCAQDGRRGVAVLGGARHRCECR